jgi:SHR-binding domain of vacuolar-sorting associated protein 13
VHVMPRYVLNNTLDLAMQYKQQGTNVELELMPGVPRAVHWSDGARPLRLCLRVHEAGWMWSGGVGLDTPGDQFVKIRQRCDCRGRGRLDGVSSTSSGVHRALRQYGLMYLFSVLLLGLETICISLRRVFRSMQLLCSGLQDAWRDDAGAGGCQHRQQRGTLGHTVSSGGWVCTIPH